MEKKQTTRGVLMVLAAALLWSSNAPFVRWIRLDAITLAGIRSIIAAIGVVAPTRHLSAGFQSNPLGSRRALFPHTS